LQPCSLATLQAQTLLYQDVQLKIQGCNPTRQKAAELGFPLQPCNLEGESQPQLCFPKQKKVAEPIGVLQPLYF